MSTSPVVDTDKKQGMLHEYQRIGKVSRGASNIASSHRTRPASGPPGSRQLHGSWMSECSHASHAFSLPPSLLIQKSMPLTTAKMRSHGPYRQ